MRQHGPHDGEGVGHVGQLPVVAASAGRAAEIVGTQEFLRRLDEAKLIDLYRSPGGHPPPLPLSTAAGREGRDMVDQGMALPAACRILIPEDQPEVALRQNQHRPRKVTASRSW